MGPRVADTLARMRTCRAAGLPVPPDLADAVITLLEGLLSARERKRLRDRELRLAAMLLPANDSPWAKAGHLLKETRALARMRRPTAGHPIRTHLQEAAKLGELPTCQKQFVRILAANDEEWTPWP